jgi:hypothetical protein
MRIDLKQLMIGLVCDMQEIFHADKFLIAACSIARYCPRTAVSPTA